MTTNTGSDNLRGAEFVDADLRGARFVRTDLSGAVMRGVDVQAADIDAPWLFEDGGSLLVNGVDVAPFVEAELNRRFPGRADRRAPDPEGLRAAWASLEQTWATTLERVDAMPAGTVDVSVAGEWSFAQTLRHLVMATDVWLRRAILEVDQPFHPIGQPHAEYATDGHDLSVFATTTPSYAEVLEARAGRVAMVRDFLATVTADDLAATRTNPWSPSHQKSVRSCLHVILNEEWEHHRYAVRDLAVLAADPTTPGPAGRVTSDDDHDDLSLVVRPLLDDLQHAVRAKDLAATLDLLTPDAALLGAAAANLDRQSASNYLTRLFEQAGYVRWDWDQVVVLDSRPGAITFVALGTVRLEGDPEDDAPQPIRLTCLAVEDSGRWRLRLFHGSIPSS